MDVLVTLHQWLNARMRSRISPWPCLKVERRRRLAASRPPEAAAAPRRCRRRCGTRALLQSDRRKLRGLIRLTYRAAQRRMATGTVRCGSKMLLPQQRRYSLLFRNVTARWSTVLPRQTAGNSRRPGLRAATGQLRKVVVWQSVDQRKDLSSRSRTLNCSISRRIMLHFQRSSAPSRWGRDDFHRRGLGHQKVPRRFSTVVALRA